MSAIGKLTLAMLGPLATPRLSAEAAETRNLCPLLVQLCNEHGGKLGPRALHLKACCTEINNFYNICNSEPRRMSETGLQQLSICICRFLANWKAWGGHCVFKHHVFPFGRAC